MAIITPPQVQQDTSINPNPDLIFVFDDLLPEWIQQWGAEEMDAFEWRYGQASYPGGDRFFGQVLKEQGICRNQPWPTIVNLVVEAFVRNKLPKLIHDARFVDNKKVIVNGQLPSTPANPHADTQSANMWTLIYHCSNTDGDNLFYNSEEIPELKNEPLINNLHRSTGLSEIKKVEFKQGRCVLFPSWYIHQGCAPSKGWRITIAHHMHIETSINPPRFITSII